MRDDPFGNEIPREAVDDSDQEMVDAPTGETGWTPGPWDWAPAQGVASGKREALLREARVFVVSGGTSRDIASVGIDRANEANANARLMARAPAMAEALRITRDNLRTLNAARMDRGIVPFDEWLAVVDSALPDGEATPPPFCKRCANMRHIESVDMAGNPIFRRCPDCLTEGA